MKALSIRAPWWWFILHGGKDIENRDWPTRFRGTVHIHASKWWKAEDIGLDLGFCDRVARTQVRDSPTQMQDLREGGGCIVGKVDIVDCIHVQQPETVSPWFFGDYGFVLANPVAFKTPIPCKGALGLFGLSEGVQAAIRDREQVCLDCDHLICVCGPNEYERENDDAR